MQIPGLVPLYEELDAARFAHYTYREWLELRPEERALAIAHCRLNKFIELHANDAQQRAMEREIRKARRRGR